MKLLNFFKLVSGLTLSLCTAGCAEGLLITPTTDGGILIKAQKKTPPRINSLDYSPKTTVRKDDVITFMVDANSKSYNSLQYTWKSSKGSLLSNSGTTVSWKPSRADGSIETGIATVTVTVSDGSDTADASANIYIGSDGSIRDNNYSGYDYSPKVIPTPHPSYTSKPTPYPSVSSRPGSGYNDYYSTRKVIFEDNFENGYLNDKWTISYKGYSVKNYLTWKKLRDEDYSGNNVLVLTGPTDDVLSNTCDSEVMITSQSIDLRRVKLPRLSFDVMSYANPSSSAKLNIYWSHEGKAPRSMNVSFIPDKNWDNVDIDLQNILSQEEGAVGLLSIGGTICGNKNEFRGPMIDNIKIYDDSVK